MKTVSIGHNLIKTLKPTGKQYEVRDTKLKGFLIRVQASGTMSYVCEYKRGKRINISRVGILSPMQARSRAQEIIGDSAKGIDPLATRGVNKASNKLKDYIENQYKPWALLNIKSGEKTVDNIVRCFYPMFGNKSLKDINIYSVETWRNKRLSDGIARSTINRDLSTLKAALSKAVDWELIEDHPLKKLKPLKIDGNSKVRYLSKIEESNLRKALDDREQQIIKERDNANNWRNERGYEAYPDLNKLNFIDHLKPMVLLSLNTGMRQGEVFNLTWDMINFNQKILTVHGSIAKSSKLRHIPLNHEALNTLIKWHDQSQLKNNLVFPSKNDKPFDNVKSAWTKLLKMAGIENFRWHDMRHHFASRLVMAGVDLNTVRELLGHSEISMTLRYAHLAPEHKAGAVAKLNF
tara:strand:- start:806 stop:2026 length:1221 start_codon:yes stop_codon:yes gene_type:complete